jgi:hypothetical protein
MGYLNVEVIATNGSSAAVSVESAWVGTAATSVEVGSSQPLATRMTLSAAGAPATPSLPCCFRWGCVAAETGVLGHSHSYIVVGEYHAYWNATGDLTYTRGASSSIGSYQGASTGPFNFQGYDTFSTSQSLSMGMTGNGQYDSHQMVVSIDFAKTSWVLQNAGTGATCQRWDQIDEDGLYDPGHGWLLFKQGRSVISHDGAANFVWESRHRPQFMNRISPNGHFALDQGSGITYGVAGDVFGVGIQAETSHSSDTAQSYTAGSSNARTHWVWGSNASLGHNPQVEYSY